MPGLKANSSTAPVITDFHKSTSKVTFDFGAIDRNKYVGEISYASVVADNGGQWIIPISGVLIGKTFWKLSFNVLIDTGNPDSLEISRWALDYHSAQIPHAIWISDVGTYSFPCDFPLPDLILGVGDPGRVRIRGNFTETFKVDENANICRSNLHDGSAWGKNIIELLFVVFDYGNRRVGLAQKSSYYTYLI